MNYKINLKMLSKKKNYFNVFLKICLLFAVQVIYFNAFCLNFLCIRTLTNDLLSNIIGKTTTLVSRK
jgi:hypothetical protein